MEVDLSPFFAGAMCALVDSNGAELAISRAFASAANACYEAHQPQHSWNQQQPQRSRTSVTVQLCISSPLLSWTRQAKDVVLRCVDRAVTRIFPPLDVLQYIGADSPVFLAADASASREKAGSHLCVTFAVQPSAALWPSWVIKQHAVEGEVVTGVQLGDSETGAAAALQWMRDTLSDMDLWNRARAAHQLYDTSIALDGVQQRSGGISASDTTSIATAVALPSRQQACEEKHTKLQWQLARWLTELFMNEGSWARLPASPSTGAPRSAQKRPVNAATRRLFQSPLRPSFSHVVEAALSAPHTTTQNTAPGSVVPRRLLHADVRGVECNGLLVGHTSRYAYIAVPYFTAPGEAATTGASSPSCVWSFISRIPIPAILSESAGRDAEGRHGEKGRLPRKRPRASASHHPDIVASEEEESSCAAAARSVLAHCLNVEEAMRHDTNAEAVFRLADAPFVVTVRAHRVYCARADPSRHPRTHPAAPSSDHFSTKPQPAASPYTLSLVLEDAYVMQVRSALSNTGAAPTSSAPTTAHWATALLCGYDPQQSPENDGEAGHSATQQGVNATIARAPHTFPDVVSVVRESCHRFQRSHERFRALYARCVQACDPSSSPAASSTPKAVEVVAGGASSATAQQVPTTAAALVPEAAVKTQTLSPAVASQNLRLLRQAEAVYGALSDSVSVHFGKLRGAARVPVPDVRTAADVAQLEECHNVEFKARVGRVTNGSSAGADSHQQRHPVLMDAERLRNTMAAMAACRGGVILLGVADDGRILGHAKQLGVARQLRTSGFCPAMVKDTVHVKELRWLSASGGLAGASKAVAGESGGNGASVPVKPAMPENWWKSGATPPAPGLPKASATAKAGASAGDQVITVVSVQKGQAPFYATSKNAPPYQRGCASTTMMPTMVVARRIMKELA
ncbi:conserved hypothetical protein [Leishmania infantum JPCM5]|uniref:Uncharacterized protein n=2 Tax=Leishmania infantum TaxID=5671 RepID=A0A381ML15_LEIIN|nr:conserved hypothetical protein [Leishmania infantum JPCM5]CAC9499812.1 hypothetical_protein_-_conserved [Leishmania infantum]CAC9499830.1 hypothetical_protein_-_conserved [Leishmania infantum]CAC9499849.1 hypothetical_protein_-_conserved [Leishmania infantum]CAM69223.1 conserved hypothetical protein [Leishmania infantum JPCM5]SUZ43033.1 hypothetical_protein_-_conserved [Leishmania infantum]|eukprot:XP_001466502.1 conserved hypothetical protein [Leishmania infantum JPCM5]